MSPVIRPRLLPHILCNIDPQSKAQDPASFMKDKVPTSSGANALVSQFELSAPINTAAQLTDPLGASQNVSGMFGQVPASTDPARAALAEVSRVADRYGEAGKAGWSPLPDVLLFNQHKLGLGSEDLNVLLNMLAHYYTPGAMPFVRPNVIAKRMGVSTRSVQRSIARLRKKRLIAIARGTKKQIVHDLTPLIARLQPFAKDRIADRRVRQATRLEQTLTNSRPRIAEG